MIGTVSTNAITPIIYPEKFKIDYAKDVVPITDTVDIPAFLLATTKDFNVDSVAGLINYAATAPRYRCSIGVEPTTSLAENGLPR